MTVCRVLEHAPAEGAWNMAVDEVLLEQTADGGRPCLRFYQWRRPTLSLGYFQSFRERAGHEASASCPLVRRATGGGAILHDRELTYSLALPVEHPAASQAEDLYLVVHQTLVAALADLGATATVRGASPARPSSEEPFLCFQRAARGDVLIDDVKVAGSAQRRRHGAVLQHGSILLASSPAAPELPGVAELSGQTVDVEPLIETWLPRLASSLSIRPASETLTNEEHRRIERLIGAKYGAESWNQRR